MPEEDPREVTVTVVRISVPESSHSHRRQEVQNLLRVLRDELHVHGLTIIEGMRGIELGGPVQAATVGDVLRRGPDPAMTIQFFDKPEVVEIARRMLRKALPECRVLWWQASSDEASLKKALPTAAGAS